MKISLRRADLRGATFRGANLRHVDLTNANMIGADLRAADFTCAYLCGAVLLEANLHGAIVAGALMDGCQYEEDRWEIVGGKFMHKDLADKKPALKAEDEYNFARKFDIASRLIDELNVVPENHRRDILAVLCKKYNVKISG